jgi:hypothetical protein
MKIDWRRIDIKDLAAVITEKLKEKGMDAILVGGACVSIYTKNKYLSSDLDFISHASLKKISSALSELAFKRKSSRHFVRKDCPFFIEFVAPPAAIGSEPIKLRNEIKTKLGKIILLTPTDSVRDRLAAFYYWNDPQALEQALMVAKAQRINFREIKRWSVQDGYIEKYNVFITMIKKQKGSLLRDSPQQ